MLTGFKTVIVGVLLAVLGALQGLDWLSLISDPEIAGWVVSGIGVVMTVLRLFTTTPVAAKKPEA